MKLASPAYYRGMLTSMLAARIQTLMGIVKRGDVDILDGTVAAGDNAGAIAELCKVRGIGPRVAETAWMLGQRES